MVQVDVFWSYGIGAGLAVAASEQLAAEAKKKTELVASGYFSKMLLFVATIFAPSGIFLLWGFPSWETMHVADRDMSALIVTAFAVTNVSQGVLGYVLARRAIAGGKRYRAFLHCILAYFGMFFILVHGWDGTGYQRFFSASREQFEQWAGAGQILAFLTSDVAFGLYGLGVFFLPALLGLKSSWLSEGHLRSDPASAPRGRVGLSAQFLVAVYGLGLGPAVVCSVVIHLLGPVVGVVAGAGVMWLLFAPRRSPGRSMFRALVPAGRP